MNAKKSFNRNQLMALGIAILLSPALRLFPAAPARLAGRASWLTAIVAVPVLLLYIYFITRFMAARQEGEGLGQLTLRVLGRRLGVPALLLSAAWLLLYAGFVLRSGADRFITTIYPRSSPRVFTVTMGILCLVAALGRVRSVVRLAKIVLPVLLGTLLLILIFAMLELDPANLLPVTYHDAPSLLTGALPVIDVLSVTLYLPGFLVGMMPREKGSFKSWSLWLVSVCLLLTALCIAVVGSFGPALTARLTHPFFSLVRNLVFFNTLERIEALVVTLWIFPDFLLVSLLLWSAQLCLRLVLRHDPTEQEEKRLDMSRGRWLIWVCAAVVIASGLLIAPSPQILQLWSERIVPGVNLAYAFAFLPLVWFLGRLRKAL